MNFVMWASMTALARRRRRRSQRRPPPTTTVRNRTQDTVTAAAIVRVLEVWPRVGELWSVVVAELVGTLGLVEVVEAGALVITSDAFVLGKSAGVSCLLFNDFKRGGDIP